MAKTTNPDYPITEETYVKDIFDGFADTIRDLKVNEYFTEAIDLIVFNAGRGKLITTGMGKAGIVMKNFSALLCSLGISSTYLHPGEASHGDLGLVSPKDILFVASTSGKTREVIECIELARNLGVKSVVSITSHTCSPVREKSDVVIDMGAIKETEISEGFDLPPTNSILAMMAITDALAIICAREMKFTCDDYLKFHHSGYLGQAAKERSSRV